MAHGDTKSSLQLVLHTMSRVLRVDEHLSSEQLGTALSRMWTVNGLALELVDIIDVCAVAYATVTSASAHVQLSAQETLT